MQKTDEPVHSLCFFILLCGLFYPFMASPVSQPRSGVDSEGFQGGRREQSCFEGVTPTARQGHHPGTAPTPIRSAASLETTSGHFGRGYGVMGLVSPCPAASGPQDGGLAGLLLSGTGQAVCRQLRRPARHRATAEGLPPASAQPAKGRCPEQRSGALETSWAGLLARQRPHSPPRMTSILRPHLPSVHLLFEELDSSPPPPRQLLPSDGGVREPECTGDPAS